MKHFSRTPLSLVLDTRRISDRAFRVAALLAYYQGTNGECWPRVATLARELDWNERTVQRAISELVKSGALVVLEDVPGKARKYRLGESSDTPVTGDSDVAGDSGVARTSDRSVTTGPTDLSLSGDNSVAHPVTDLSTQKEDDQGRRSRKTISEEGPALARVLPIAARRAAQTDDEVVRDIAREAFVGERLSPPDGLEQLTLGRWVRRQAELDKRELADVAAELLTRFLAHPRARSQGYPLAYLAKNPLEYWGATRGQSVGTFKPTPADVLAELGER